MKNDKIYYNLEKLTKVKLVDKKEDGWYEYSPAKTKLFGLIKEKEGIYYNGYSRSFSCEIKDIKKEFPNHLFSNNILYKKPHIELIFSHNNSEIHRFDTYEEAKKVAEQIKKISKCNFEISK